MHIEIRRLLKVGNVSIGMFASHGENEMVGIEIEPQTVKVLLRSSDSYEETTHEFQLEMCTFEPASGSALRHYRNDFNVRLRLSDFQDSPATSNIVQEVSCAFCENQLLKSGLKLRPGINLTAFEMDALFGNTEFFCHAHGHGHAHGDDSNEESNEFMPSKPNFEPGVSEFIEDTKRLIVRSENVNGEALVTRFESLFCARCGICVAENGVNTVDFDAERVAIFQDGAEAARKRTSVSSWFLNEAAIGKKLSISQESNGSQHLLLQVMDGDLLVIDKKLQVDKGKNVQVKVRPRRCVKLLYRLLSDPEAESPWKMDRFVKSVQMRASLFKELLETLAKSTSGLHARHLKSVDGFLVAYVDNSNSP